MIQSTNHNSWFAVRGPQKYLSRIPILVDRSLTPGYLSLWYEVSFGLEWNLKTQRGFNQGDFDLLSNLNLKFEIEQFLLPRNPVESKGFPICLGLVQEVCSRHY